MPIGETDRAEPAEEAAAPWRPMSSAPHDRPVLLKMRWGRGYIAIVGAYTHVHGCFCTPALFGMSQQMLFPDLWAEIPDFD